jgi:hypothetical protein
MKTELMMLSTPTLTLPLPGGGDLAPSSLQGEGWDGGSAHQPLIKQSIAHSRLTNP